MKINDDVGCRQANVSEKMEAAFEGRQDRDDERWGRRLPGSEGGKD